MEGKTVKRKKKVEPTLFEMNKTILHIAKVLGVVQTDVSTLKSDVSTLKTDVSSLKTDVAELKTDVAELKTDVAELKTDVSTLKIDVAELKTDVSELKTTVARLDASNDKIILKLTEHDERMDTFATKAEMNQRFDEVLVILDDIRGVQKRHDTEQAALVMKTDRLMDYHREHDKSILRIKTHIGLK